MIKAIVIGVEQYPSLQTGVLVSGEVPGAVADALAFHEWLTTTEGLKEEEVSLHLSPAAAHPKAKPATRGAIRAALREMRASRLAPGRRFFFFTGHGFSSQDTFNGDYRDVIVCEDFVSPMDMEPTIPSGDIFNWLREMGPREEYFFFDCCRNTLAPAALSLPSLGLNEPRDPTFSFSSQLALFAAHPGETTPAPSPFVRTLLAGLRGTGSARVWSGPSLVVTFQSLTEYLAQKLKVAPDQTRRGVLPGVILTVFTEGQQNPPVEPCQIQVEGVKPDHRLVVHARQAQSEIAHAELVGGRGELSLVPRTYSVAIESPDGRYGIAPATVVVDLFEPARVEARAVPIPLAFPVGPGHKTNESAHLARLSIQLPPSALVDILDADKNLVEPLSAQGRSRLDMELPAGRYTVRLWQNGRVLLEEPTTLARGKPAVVDLEPKPRDPVRLAMQGMTGGSVFMPSEALGPIVDQRLSLWLGITAVKAASGRPVPPFDLALPAPGAESGAAFVVIASATAPRVRMWTPGGGRDVPVNAASGVPHLHLAVLPDLPCGVHVIGWETARGTFSMTFLVLPFRTTTVVVVDMEGEPRSAHLFLAVHRDHEADLPPDERPGASPGFGARWLVNAQEAFARAEPLDPSPPPYIDPLAELLAAHCALREVASDRAKEHLATLQARWPTLPDVVVLERLLGGPAGRVQGLPLVADGSCALAAWLATEAPPRAGEIADAADCQSLLDRAAPEMVWTTWVGWPFDALTGPRPT